MNEFNQRGDLTHRTLAEFPHSPRLKRLHEVLEQEQAGAEATLGRSLIAPYAFAADCLDPQRGLGEALNREADRVDQLDYMVHHHQSPVTNSPTP